MNRRSETIGIGVVAIVVVAVLAVMFIGGSNDPADVSTERTQTERTQTDATLRTPGDSDRGRDTDIVLDRTIEVGDLPDEAIETLLLIDSDGPFPYNKDGSTFQNREGRLPDAERGYYREYTVDTPGSNDRGARRIVAGDAGELFYTDDHYDSFRQVTGW